jgi:hypothetical protein
LLQEIPNLHWVKKLAMEIVFISKEITQMEITPIRVFALESDSEEFVRLTELAQ